MAYTINHYITDWVEESRALMQPDKVLWIDGTETQLEELRREAYITGELIKLNQEKLPGCVYHRSALNDVARVEGRTFICCKKEEDAGPTNNWMAPDEMKAKLHDIYAGCMRGRTMYVIPYSMGAIGSPFAKYGIEITDSIYVVCCMAIMTRVGTKVYEALGDSPDFVKGLHSKAELDADKRYIAHFPEENTHYVRQLRLRRQRAARQEVLRAAHRLLRWAVRRAGSPSTCSFSACRTPRARSATSAARSRPPAARPTSPCSFPRRRGVRRAGSAGASATISPGCAPARTDGSGPSTRKTASSASPPARAKRRTPTLSPRRARTPSSRTSSSSRTAPSGGKGSTRTRRRTRSTGRASRGIPPPACPARIRTPASPLRRSTVRAFPANLKIRRACRISAIVFGGRRAKTAPLVYQ